MVNQTERALGTVGFADPAIIDPTTSKPYEESGKLRQEKEIARQEEQKISLPKEIINDIEEKREEEILDFSVEPDNKKSLLRPRTRPKPKRQSPIDKVLELNYLVKGKPTKDSKTTQIISNLYEGKEEDQKAIKGFMDTAVGGDTGYDPTVTAWCAAFVAHILEELGADPLNVKDKYKRLRANEYRNYGSAVDIKDIKEGDIVVFDFDKNNIGDHVTFYAGDRITSQGMDNYVNVIGGNQGRGEVSIRENYPKYTWDNVVAIRRITYNDIDFDFTQEMAKQDPVFNNFLPEYA